MTSILTAILAAAIIVGGDEQLSCSDSPIHEFIRMSSHISILDLTDPQETEFCHQTDACVPNLYMSDQIVRAVRDELFPDGKLSLERPPGEGITMILGPNRSSCSYVFEGYRNLVFWDGDEVLLAIPFFE